MFRNLVPIVLLGAVGRPVLVRRAESSRGRGICLLRNQAERKDAASWAGGVRVHILVNLDEVRPELRSGHRGRLHMGWIVAAPVGPMHMLPPHRRRRKLHTGVGQLLCGRELGVLRCERFVRRRLPAHAEALR